MKSLFIALLLTTNIHAALFYSETESGDLSHIVSNPTHIGTFLEGDNVVTGSVMSPVIAQADVFTFTIDEGLFLTGLEFTLAPEATEEQAHFLGFHGEDGSFSDVETFLFATLITESQNGQNILPLLTDGGTAAAGEGPNQPQGYDFPLASGDYSIWFQENDGSTVDYEFTFTVAPVPEPSSALLLSLSSLALFVRRR